MIRQLPVAVMVVEAGSLRIVELNDRARDMTEGQLERSVPEKLDDTWEIFHPRPPLRDGGLAGGSLDHLRGRRWSARSEITGTRFRRDTICGRRTSRRYLVLDREGVDQAGVATRFDLYSSRAPPLGIRVAFVAQHSG